jgi:hypothetical protein
MATGNQGSYGGYRGNPYAGKGMGLTQSPYVEPFVDYSRDMGKQMRSWYQIHQENLNKIEEKVEGRKTDFLTAVDNARSIYLKDGLHGHQKDGSTIQVPKLDGEGKKILIDENDPDKGFEMEDKVLKGEGGDMKALVEEYRQTWLASRGITKNKRGKLTGWASGSETTGGSLEARAEAEKIKATMEDFAADKSLYKEEQAALYNDLGDLNMIGLQTENESYDDYVKFMHPDNKTEFVKGKGMMIYSSDGDSMSMKDLSKLKPDLENPELQTNLNKGVDKFSSGDLNKYVINTQVPTADGKGFTTQQSLNIGMISRDIDTLFNGMNYDDIRDIIMNHSFRDNEGNPVNFYNSDVSNSLSTIYQLQAKRDLDWPGSVNHKMLKEREKNGKLTSKEKYFNDGNFVLDAEYIESLQGMSAKEMEQLGLNKEEAENMRNFISNFEMPENLRGKNMPMSRYVQEKVKDYYGKIGQDLVGSRINAPGPGSDPKLVLDKYKFDKELEFKYKKLEEDNQPEEVLSYFDYITSNVKRGNTIDGVSSGTSLEGSFDEINISDLEENIQGMNTKGAGIDISVNRAEANNKTLDENKTSLSTTKEGQGDQVITDLSGVLLPGDNVTVTITDPEVIKQIKAMDTSGKPSMSDTKGNEELKINVPYTGKYTDFAASLATALKGTDLQFDPSEIRKVK